MNRSDYKRLGNYIREVDVRNRDLAVTNLLGLSMTKQFRPSTSNIVGVDLSKYKVVNNNVFAFDPMSVIRVHKVPIALNETDSPIIVSPAYITFESIDVDLLNPQYLMMWFRRAEFDRYADFKSDSSVRGGYNWDELCETMVCIPSIERQRAMVAEYETLSRRIGLNRSMIAQLEATAQTLYRKMFVDDIDPEHLPHGWRWDSIFNLCDVVYGFPFDSSLFTNMATRIPVIRIRDIINNTTNTYTTEQVQEKYLIQDGDILIGMDGNFQVTIWNGGRAYLNQRVVRIRPKPDMYIPALQIVNAIKMPLVRLQSAIEGTTVAHLSDKDMKQLRVLVAPVQKQMLFYRNVHVIASVLSNALHQQIKFSELQSLLLTKMGQ